MRRTGHIRTKTLSILIVILSAFLISNIVVFATEDLDAENPNPGEILETEIEAEEIETITGGSLDEPEILLEQYIEEKAETIVEEAMNGEVGSETYPPASARYWKLGDAEKKAYLKIKEMLESIAAGETNDAEVTLTYAELYSDDILNAKYTAADLDVGDIALQNENGEWELTSEAMDIIVTKYPELNTRSIMTAISRDCPELLYWFDKTVGMISASGRFLGAEKNDEWTIWCTDKSYYSFGFWVADEYVGGYVTDEDGDECKYIVDTELTSSVNDALAYAAEIVSDNSSSSDIDKLTVYKDVICDQVSYNHGATAEGTAYGNPWQIIYVFDKDPNTNVVCEGYSKAFKFLCDLTSFKDSSLSCSIVTGLMGGGTGAGGHMWNIVSVGGKNYLVDVTNCDAGTIGAPDALFMVGNDSMAAATVNKNGKSYDSETYTFSINKTNVSYTYDADTVTIFDQGERLLATSNYENDPSDPSEPNKSDEPTTIGLSAASVSGIANKTYNGKAQTQSITVKNGSDILAVGTDYMIAYSNNTNAGTAEVTITGMGSYTGSITKTFTIAPAKVTAPTAKTGLVYTGKSQTGVAAGANYTVATGSATNAGNYTAVAKLKDSRNYTWSDGSKADKKISWKITSKKITPAVTLSATAYTWNGKVKKPVVTVKAGSSTLTASQYSVKYASGRKNVGTYNVTVTLKGNYSGSKTVSFKINPKGTSISKLTTQQKAFTAIWSKQASKMSGRVTGYQLQYSTRKDFKSVNKTVTVTGWSKTSKKVTGLKAKTTYYVRVRTYTKSGGKTYYSGWSKIKTVKTPAAPVAAKTIGTVYWVANGKVYHLNKNCSTLSRSKNIQSGTIAQSGKASACKVCGH